MPRLHGRARNIGRRTQHAPLVHNRRLNRTAEQHSTHNLRKKLLENIRNDDLPEQNPQILYNNYRPFVEENHIQAGRCDARLKDNPVHKNIFPDDEIEDDSDIKPDILPVEPFGDDIIKDECDVTPDPIPVKPYGDEMNEEVSDIKPDPLPVKPFGDDLLRVCRTCFRVMKVEDAIPLISSAAENSVEETELCTRLKSLLQIELFPVEKPCLCKNCVNFINAIHMFRATCYANENVLKYFDWDCKTLNMLYIVDQKELKAVYDQTMQVKFVGEEENGANSITGNTEVKTERNVLCSQQDGIGNVMLEDMQDGCPNQTEQIDDYYIMNTPTTSANCSLSKDDDLSAPNFDRNFRSVQNRSNQRMRAKYRWYHVRSRKKNSFVCEFCGKVQTSRVASNRHMKLQKSNNSFCCTLCNKVFSEWTGYVKHYKLVHGSCPKVFSSPYSKKYLDKKMLDAYLERHKRREDFDDKSLFNGHKLLHRSEKNASKLCVRSVNRGLLKEIFPCSWCCRSYTKIGCLELHKKHCKKEK